MVHTSYFQEVIRDLLGIGQAITYPSACVICRQPCLPVEGFPGLCRTCLGNLPWRMPDDGLRWPQGQTDSTSLSARSFGKKPAGISGENTILCPLWYQSPVRESLIRMKFHDAPEVAEAMAGILAQTMKRKICLADAVVAVPLHERRLRERGYNQAGLIAAALAGRLRVADLSGYLVRTRYTPRQSEQSDHNQRWSNLAGAFELVPGAKDIVAGRHILLIDDIMTTGATLSAAAAPLICAGTRVTGLVAASDHKQRQGSKH